MTPSKTSANNRLEQITAAPKLLIEAAWEVCNQVGGIYTVIKTKVPAACSVWGQHYVLLGPYHHDAAQGEFEHAEPGDDPIGRAVRAMWDMGYYVHYGTWLVSGSPKVVLFEYDRHWDRLGTVKYEYWSEHGISTDHVERLVEKCLLFGHMVKEFYYQLTTHNHEGLQLIGHFHEWMAGTALPGIRKAGLPVHTVFTTHATLLGRYLAGNDTRFYENLPFIDWLAQARHFGVEPTVRLERAASHAANIMTTVSEVTARECIQLLGRRPDYILPNGLNVERFVALHEFQNLHLKFKERIHEFTMGHFFSSYSFDLDKTLYLFTSGRFEYSNKGFDLTLEALARLNYRMKQTNSEMTVVMFIVTKQPVNYINPHVLQSRAVMEEVRDCCRAIEKSVGEGLFYTSAAFLNQRLPDLNTFVDDYWRLRLRRTLQSWKSTQLPLVVTHNLQDDAKDPVLQFVRRAQLVNNHEDRVKIVYHPDFISPTNPLFSMEYGQFVRGCHLGVFPSYYEPWGYTPLECVASGVPTVTSDLSGFGDYVKSTMPDHDDYGIYLVERSDKSFDQAADQLADILFRFSEMTRRERINQRNRVESTSVTFGWDHLYKYYEMAYGSISQLSLV